MFIPKRVSKGVRQLREEFDFITRYKTVSVFYVTDTQARAERITFLERNGIIKRIMNRVKYPYPDCRFITYPEKMAMLVQTIKENKRNEYVVSDNPSNAK